MTLTAFFAPLHPRITALEQRLDTSDRARRALETLRTTPATFITETKE